MIRTAELFDLEYTLAKPLLEKTQYPWESLGEIGEFLKALGPALPKEEYEEVSPTVWIAKTVKRYPNVYIEGPCIICPGAELRPGAFLRGNVLVGRDAVVGNSTELKNVILFDGVQVPHYNYVGDSVLGRKAHMGAGAVTSNVKGNKTNVVIHAPDGEIPTGRKKVGAFLGDGAEIGCGCVLNPGSVVGKNSQIYPQVSFRGVLEADSICKAADITVKKA